MFHFLKNIDVMYHFIEIDCPYFEMQSFTFQWEQKVEKGQEDFETISKNIKKEMLRFEKMRVVDFKDKVIKYLEILMDNQEKVSLKQLKFEKIS